MKRTFLLTLFSVAACAPVNPPPQADPSSSAPGVMFSAERAGATAIRLALDNGSSGELGYNLCTSELQRRVGADWAAVPTDEMCTMQVLTLGPGHDATFEKRLPGGLAAGEYRYVTRIESPSGSTPVDVATRPFSHGGS